MTFADFFGTRSVLILDGGLGAYLESTGALPQTHAVRDAWTTKLWSAGLLLERPEVLVDAHVQFLAAGADIVTSSSYQLTYEGLAGAGGRPRAEELFQLSTAVARSACARHSAERPAAGSTAPLPPPPRVAASLGCYCAHLADGSEYTAGGYRGVGVEQLTAFHAEKLAALVATRPDAVAFETIPCVDEVKAVTALLSSSGVPDGPPGAPVAWVALACQSPELLNSGETLEDALRALEDPPSGAPLDVDHVAVGVNCTDPRHVRAILRTMRDTCRRGRVLVAYPNLGETWEQAPEGSDGNGGGGGAWAPVAGTGVAEAEYVALARGWYDGGDGATIIGGCCRVNPPLIAELKRALC